MRAYGGWFITALDADFDADEPTVRVEYEITPAARGDATTPPHPAYVTITSVQRLDSNVELINDLPEDFLRTLEEMAWEDAEEASARGER